MRRPLRTVVALAVACLVGAGCGGDAGSPRAACPSPSAAGDLSALPDGLDLDDFFTVSEVAREGKFVSAQGLGETPIPELFPRLVRSVKRNFTVLSVDNEGFEAELFFADPEGRTGLLTLREGPCEGQVTMKLIFG